MQNHKHTGCYRITNSLPNYVFILFQLHILVSSHTDTEYSRINNSRMRTNSNRKNKAYCERSRYFVR